MSNNNKLKFQKDTGKQTSTATTSNSSTKLLLLAGILLLTFISFYPTLNNGFINQDDDVYVFNNDKLGRPLPEATAYFFGLNYYAGNYTPLTMMVYTFVYHTFGSDAVFYHGINLLLHLLNVLLVFWFIYLLSGKKTMVAAMVALFFGIHPLHVESVAWIAELKDVLYTLFYMAGCISYYKYISHQSESDAGAAAKQHSLFPLLLTFVFFVCAVLSKPSAVIFPVTLLLLDFYTKRRLNYKLLLEKLPFIIVSVIIGLITIEAQRTDKMLAYQFPVSEKLVYAAYGLVMYLCKFLFPLNLSNFYPYPNLAQGPLPVLCYVAPVALVIIAYGVWSSYKYTRIIVFGSLFFVVNLLLTLQFLSVGNAVIADRYTYIAYIGLLFIVAMGTDHIYHNTKLKRYSKLVFACIAIFACSFVCVTYSRALVWKDANTLADDVLHKYPADPIALNNKGYLAADQRDYQSAIALYKQAILNRPKYVKAEYIKPYVNLAHAYESVYDTNSALSTMNDALKYAPNDYSILAYNGYLLTRKHQYKDAIKYLNASIRIKNDYIEAYINLGDCYYRCSELDSSIRITEAGLKIDPDNYILLNNMGYYIGLAGHIATAIPYFQASLKIKPDFVNASQNLAGCYRYIEDSINKSKQGK